MDLYSQALILPSLIKPEISACFSISSNILIIFSIYFALPILSLTLIFNIFSKSTSFSLLDSPVALDNQLSILSLYKRRESVYFVKSVLMQIILSDRFSGSIVSLSLVTARPRLPVSRFPQGCLFPAIPYSRAGSSTHSLVTFSLNHSPSLSE